MTVTKSRIALFTDKPDDLAAFYEEIMGFERVIKINKPDDYGYTLQVAPGYKMWIGRHSEVSGINPEPFRVILSFYVDNIFPYFDKIRALPVHNIVQEPTLSCEGIPGEERYVGAFLDIAGNCVQLMQIMGK